MSTCRRGWQIIGFVLLIFGTVVYNEIVYVPILMEHPSESSDVKMVRHDDGTRHRCVTLVVSTH